MLSLMRKNIVLLSVSSHEICLFFMCDNLTESDIEFFKILLISCVWRMYKIVQIFVMYRVLNSLCGLSQPKEVKFSEISMDLLLWLHTFLNQNFYRAAVKPCIMHIKLILLFNLHYNLSHQTVGQHHQTIECWYWTTHLLHSDVQFNGSNPIRCGRWGCSISTDASSYCSTTSFYASSTWS